MKSFRFSENGTIINPRDLISCKFRGAAVNCSASDFAAGACATCGWNPLVEAEREARLKGKKNV